MLGISKHSLPKEGQREPIDLTGEKPYKIIDGFRRVEAVKALGWTTVKALVHEDIKEGEAHKLAFLKNVVRKNLSPMEKANAIYQAKQRGMKAAELNQSFGISEKQLKRYETLLKFPTAVQKRLESGEISMAHAKVLSDFKVKDLTDWVAKIKDSKLSAKQMKRELKKASGSKLLGPEKLYLRKEKNGIRMYPFIIKKDAPKEEREKVAKLLKDAIEVLEG